MAVREFRYDASNGEYQIKALLWTPEERGVKIRGVLQIAHGMHEYSERYADFAQYMTAQGFAVCINDHAGHGDSYKDKNLRGYFGAKDGYVHMVRDMHRLMELTKAEYQGLPYFLLGHSMGSFLARNFAAMYGGELSGAIFSGTGNAPAALQAGLMIAHAQKFFRGGTSSGAMLLKISGDGYLKHFKPVRTRSDWLSRDEKIVDAFINEPKTQFVFTVNGYLDLFHMLEKISSPKWAAKLPAKLPVLLFSGSEDPVGNYGKDVKMVYDWLKAAGCADVTMKIYDGGRHEMLNELNRAEVYENVGNWIKTRA